MATFFVGSLGGSFVHVFFFLNFIVVFLLIFQVRRSDVKDLSLVLQQEFNLLERATANLFLLVVVLLVSLPRVLAILLQLELFQGLFASIVHLNILIVQSV